MKNKSFLIALSFSFLTLYSSLSVAITYIYYNVDTAGFIKNLCKNIDKPALACNGKCHLKKITKTEGEEKNVPIQLIDFKDILLYHQKNNSFHFTENTFIIIPNFQYSNLYKFNFLETHFHPPNA